MSSRSVGLFQTAPRPASLLEVFLQRYANLLRFAESLTRDRREAEDLVQDACVRLLVAPTPAPAPTSAPARSPRGLSESTLLSLEVDVLERLDRAGALYGEDLTLTRPRSGYLRLEGMVDHP